MRCLAYRSGELWACADGFGGSPFAVGRSTDDGDTFEPLWSFGDVVNELGCRAGTATGDTCPTFWPDLLNDLMLLDGGAADAGPPDGGEMDAGVDGGVGPGGGGCRCTAGRAPVPLAWPSVIALAALAGAARRRPKQPGSRSGSAPARRG
jgi:hypothetical protein